MNRSRKTSLALVSLVVGLLMALAATSALASPAGDEDIPAFTGDGAVFNSTDQDTTPNGDYYHDQRVPPLTTQDPATKDVLVAGAFSGEGNGMIRIARFKPDGTPVASYGTDGAVDIGTSGVHVGRLLDLRVVGDTTWVLFADDDGALNWVKANSDGTATDTHGPLDADTATTDCPDVKAARVRDNGEFAVAWDCTEQTDTTQTQAQATEPFIRFADISPDTGFRSQTDLKTVTDAVDVELGPNDVYLLAGEPNGATVLRFTVDPSNAGNLLPDATGNFVRTIGGRPVDLAVDSQDRALVWTNGETHIETTSTPWEIHRLSPGNGAPDNGWGTGGVVSLTADVLGDPDFTDLPMLLARSDGKVLAKAATSDGSSEVIVRLNSNGSVDTGWGASGYKTLGFAGGDESIGFGSMASQIDLKTLIAFNGDDRVGLTTRSFGPAPGGPVMGAGRLKEGSPSHPGAKPSNPSAPDQGGVAGTSAKGSVCGRRAISLVRAFSRGGKVELQGLVGSAYYGKKVTIYASSGHGFRKVKTTRATRTGTFATKVRRPHGRRFITIRYIAKADRSKSPVLKLPQSLKSTSIKERAGKITVKGHVKRALLGSRRNKVKIQRLVCGHYKTVGSARPTRGGRYVVTFNTPVLGGVAYFRARGVVLNKPHGRYVVQYARAIRIKLTDQTG